jgi:hypothetical protein
MPDEVIQVQKPEVPYRSVRIPACVEHQGLYAITIRIPWICPKCGGPRGKLEKTASFDRHYMLENVDGWRNPCGHQDTYHQIRAKYAASGQPQATPLDILDQPRHWEERE